MNEHHGRFYIQYSIAIVIMKIGILTQPLHSNYGGLLQAWALQKSLTDMGHEVTIINRIPGKINIPLWRKFALNIKENLLIVLNKRKRYLPVTPELKEYSESQVIPFRKNRYTGISPEIKSNEEFLSYINNTCFDAFVVGSDQVWRPMYSPNLMTYFLDFAKDNTTVKKIAYAASFGVDSWELSKSDTEKAKVLAPQFDLITVRESSGVNLVKEHLNCQAFHVLDPTMLRSKEDYLNLIKEPTLPLNESNGDLFCYVLDNSEPIKEIISNCSLQTGYRPYYCNYKTHVSQLTKKNQISDSIVPPVEQWLKSFADAKMVITDSFHGTVFSILFNKPFWVVSNSERGSARFASLLTEFGLSNRMIKNTVEIDWTQNIDWDEINKHLEMRQKESTDLLLNALKS